MIKVYDKVKLSNTDGKFDKKKHIAELETNRKIEESYVKQWNSLLQRKDEFYVLNEAENKKFQESLVKKEDKNV